MISLEGIDVEDLLERLDIENARLASGGDEINYSCPGAAHSHGDERPSAYINTGASEPHKTGYFLCQGCKMGGTAVHLVAEVKQISIPGAERWLRDTYGITLDGPKGGSMVAETEARFAEKPPKPEPVLAHSSWLNNLRIDWHSDDPLPGQQYMFSRGFSPDTMEEWDIGYDYVGDWMTIPVFLPDGTFVGAKGRDFTGRHPMKYFVIGDRTTQRYGFEPYEASLVVPGLHRNRGCKTVVICEGELNAVALSQMGIDRPVAIGMSYFSQRHAELIIREAKEAILYFDHGDAGDGAVYGTVQSSGRRRPGALELLEQHMKVRIVTPGPEDPADLLKQGRSQEAIDLILGAPTSLALSIKSV